MWFPGCQFDVTDQDQVSNPVIDFTQHPSTLPNSTTTTLIHYHITCDVYGGFTVSL